MNYLYRSGPFPRNSWFQIFEEFYKKQNETNVEAVEVLDDDPDASAPEDDDEDEDEDNDETSDDVADEDAVTGLSKFIMIVCLIFCLLIEFLCMICY